MGVEAVGPSLGDVTHAGVTPAQYLDPDIASGLPWRDLPVVDGRDPSLAELLAVAEGDPAEFAVARKEARRVGKGCRARGLPDDEITGGAGFTGGRPPAGGRPGG